MVYQEGFAQLYESEPFMMLHVNLFNIPDVTFIAKAINTIYEANVEQSETEILKLQINLILQCRYKFLKSSRPYTVSTEKKILQARLDHTLDPTTHVDRCSSH
jgi:hypothetical protein